MNITVYHKIDNVFERDVEGSKKLIEGKFRNKAVEFLKDIQSAAQVDSPAVVKDNRTVVICFKPI